MRAIGFSVLVEIVNQTMRRNQEKWSPPLIYVTAPHRLFCVCLGSKGNGGEGQNKESEDVFATTGLRQRSV